MKLESLGEYGNRMRIKHKHFGAVHTCQEFYAKKYSLKLYVSYYIYSLF